MTNISSRLIKDCLVIALSGEFNATLQDPFFSILCQSRKPSCRDVCLDFHDVCGIDSAGLGMVFLTAHQFRQRGGQCRLLNPQPQVLAQLERADLPSLVQIVISPGEVLPAA